MRHWWTLTVFLLAAASGACVPADAGPGESPASFLGWLRARRPDVALAVVSPAGPRPALLVNAGTPFPLASVRKVLILGAYADGVAGGVFEPGEPVPVADVEAWYWAGTDGGAHERARADLRQRGRIGGDPPALRLDDVVYAAVRWSDNAAADYLLARVGWEAVADFARRWGLSRQEPFGPTHGEYVAWSMTPPDQWERTSPGQRAALAWAAGVPTQGQPSRLPGDQWRYAAVSAGGSAQEWAQFLAALFTASPNDPAAAVIRRHLEWPMIAFPANAGRFARLAGKAGALPGIRTEVLMVEAHGRPPVVAVLFLRNIDARHEVALRSFIDQDFLIEMAEDPAFLDRVMAVLGPP